MARFAGAGGLLPEQIWDGAGLPCRGLYPGGPTGSAMPLMWAHAEFVKLAVSLAAGSPGGPTGTHVGAIPGPRPGLTYRYWQPRQRVRQPVAGRYCGCCCRPALSLGRGWLAQRDAPSMTADWGVDMSETSPTRLAPSKPDELHVLLARACAMAGPGLSGGRHYGECHDMIAIDLTCRRPFVSGAVAAFFVSDLTSYITGVAVG